MTTSASQIGKGNTIAQRAILLDTGRIDMSMIETDIITITTVTVKIGTHIEAIVLRTVMKKAMSDNPETIRTKTLRHNWTHVLPQPRLLRCKEMIGC